MAAIDHKGIIERIILMITSNTNLYDPEGGKLRQVLFGEPPGGKNEWEIHPFAYVTLTERPMQTKETVGSSLDTKNQFFADYEIVIMDQKDDSEEVKKSLMGYLGEIIDTFEANSRLRNPSDSLDPKALRSFIVSMDEVRDSRGSDIQGYSIILRAILGTGWQLTIPGPIVLDLLSIPIQNTGSNLDLALTDDHQRIFSEIHETDLLTVEFEDSITNHNAIRALMRADNDISVTLSNPTESENYTVHLESLPDTVPIDEIRRGVLTMHIV